MLVRHPFVTQKTIGLIHWHALRLWRRGAPFHRHGAARTMNHANRREADPQRSRDTILARIGLAGGTGRGRPDPHRRLTVVLPDGSREVFGDRRRPSGARSTSTTSAALVRMLLGGETGGGEAYMDGLWSSPDLAALLRVAALNREALALSAGWWRVPLQLRRTIAHRLRRNTRRQSRRNIAAHYDLGNDFYRLFLDETMTYSSAVFASPDQSLADAQRNKYRLIAEGAGLTQGQHVLEIGTGWGGFALYAAGELGCRVTSITISQEQHDLARERVRAAGLEDLVDIQLRDYREISGTYDAIVSIEMLEAVGAEYFATFFRTCDARTRARRADEPPVHHVPGRRLRDASAGAPTGSRPTSSRAACARRSRSSNEPPGTPACSSAASRTSALTTRARCVPGGRDSWTRSTRSGEWASTTDSCACGSTTSP